MSTSTKSNTAVRTTIGKDLLIGLLILCVLAGLGAGGFAIYHFYFQKDKKKDKKKGNGDKDKQWWEDVEGCKASATNDQMVLCTGFDSGGGQDSWKINNSCWAGNSSGADTPEKCVADCWENGKRPTVMFSPEATVPCQCMYTTCSVSDPKFPNCAFPTNITPAPPFGEQPLQISPSVDPPVKPCFKASTNKKKVVGFWKTPPV